MGVVYRGRYVVKDVDVAVKMLPADVTNPIVLARFEREVEVLKSLRHPNIVRSFGGVCEDKRQFYAMELMKGGSLEDQLQKRGRLPWEQVIEYGKQMCAALDYLHKHGVIHRDLKPANFLLDEEGTIKLSDFGLASVIASRRITSAGKTAGTLLYMAPEQIRGGDITPKTDLYALGCVLFELLTGKPPFVGDTPASTMQKHCKAEVPRITSVALDCPVALEQLIQKLLAKAPADRPENAVSVARELAQVTTKVSVVSKPRAIDRETVASSSRSVSDRRFKATQADVTQRESASYGWHFLISLVVMAGLVVWGFTLSQSVEQARVSEGLFVDAVRAGEPHVRLFALQALGKLPEVSEESMAAIAQVLDQENEDLIVRVAAAKSLGRLGERANEYLPLLRRIGNEDSHEMLRQESQRSIERIQTDVNSAGSAWILLLGLIVFVTAGGYIIWRTIGESLMRESRSPHGAVNSAR